MTEITNELMFEVLKKLQTDVAHLKPLRSETRDGFASMRQHLSAIHSDYQLLERRISEMENDMERVMRRLEIVDDSE